MATKFGYEVMATKCVLELAGIQWSSKQRDRRVSIERGFAQKSEESRGKHSIFLESSPYGTTSSDFLCKAWKSNPPCR